MSEVESYGHLIPESAPLDSRVGRGWGPESDKPHLPVRAPRLLRGDRIQTFPEWRKLSAFAPADDRQVLERHVLPQQAGFEERALTVADSVASLNPLAFQECQGTRRMREHHDVPDPAPTRGLVAGRSPLLALARECPLGADIKDLSGLAL